MYIPNKYREESWEQTEYLIKKYPLATVITFSETEGIVANHFPFYLKEENGKKYLQAHIARVNPQKPALAAGSEVLVIFKSEDTYITPDYYPGKKETHKFVPTWDFAATHIRGKSKILDDTDFVRTQLDHLTDQQEAGKETPWKVSDAPENYVKLKQKAIVGLQIEIESFEAKYKFQQDMKQPEIDGVIDGLVQDNKRTISALNKDANDRKDALKAAKALEK